MWIRSLKFQAGVIFVMLYLAAGPGKATADSIGLGNAPTIWFQGFEESSKNLSRCKYDVAKYRTETLQSLNNAPFTFLNLPGVVSLVDVPWLLIMTIVYEKPKECRAAITFIVCDKKAWVSRDAQGTSASCPTDRFLTSEELVAP